MPASEGEENSRITKEGEIVFLRTALDFTVKNNQPGTKKDEVLEENLMDVKKLLKNALEPKTDVTILIGPEGDFSTKEIEMAIEQNYTPVSLGNTRLRTETAAIVAAHSAAFINEE